MVLQTTQSAMVFMWQGCDSEVAPELSKLGFEVFLLPSPEHRQVWHSAARLPDNAALQPGAHGGLDDDIIDGLLTEVRRVISSAKFGVALKVRPYSARLLQSSAKAMNAMPYCRESAAADLPCRASYFKLCKRQILTCSDYDNLLSKSASTATVSLTCKWQSLSCLIQAAVQESAKIAADALQYEMNGDERPLAKLCPKVAELASRLLQRNDNTCVSRFAGLPEVQRLSATVYSCGPAL